MAWSADGGSRGAIGVRTDRAAWGYRPLPDQTLAEVLSRFDDPELDELKTISRSGRQVIAEMEERERARTGISSLKVRFNRVFGYYIEISKSNLHAVPGDYQRKQTIAGGERFTTPALKEYEEKVLGADERILEREVEIFDALRRRVAAEAPRIQDTARALASLDVLSSLAETAAAHNYTKPLMHGGDELIASDARHPVVERHVGGAFVPNDITLDATEHQLIVLTLVNRALGLRFTHWGRYAVANVVLVAALVIWLGHAAIAEAAIKTKQVTYEHDGVTLKGHLAWDDKIEGKRPGVLVVHEWWGLNDYAKKRAEQLAESHVLPRIVKPIGAAIASRS